MDSKPQITIVTPVWNGMPYIRECVESVLAQDFSDWEMIISDNGSTDGTRQYLSTLSDKRIQVFLQDSNLGIFGNLNFVFSKATCPFSQVLCADDYFTDSESLSRVVKYWVRQPDSVQISRANLGSSTGSSGTEYFLKVAPAYITPEISDLMFLLFGCIPGNLSNVSLRTTIVKELGGFREDLPYAGDFEFWSRAGRQCGIAMVRENLTEIRRHPGVASNYLNRRGELYKQIFEILDSLYDHLLAEDPTFATKIRLAACIIYDAPFRWASLRNDPLIRHGVLSELERAHDGSKIRVSKSLRWLVFFLSLGGRIGRVTVAKSILKQCGH